MKNPTTKVYSCRLNAEQMRQAERLAVQEGAENIGGLLKKLLIERIKKHGDADAQSSAKIAAHESSNAAQQIAALDHLRELMAMSFGLLFEATGAGEIFQSKKNSMDEKWQEIVNDFSAAPANLPVSSEREIMSPAREEEIDFSDLFSGEIFRSSAENYLENYSSEK